MVSDARGDVAPDPQSPDGLFYRDMRHLSRWQLLVNGHRLESLTAKAVEYDEAVFYLAQATGTVYRNPTMSLERSRHVGDGMHEELIVTNHGLEPVTLELSMLVDADFADVFEIKDKQGKTSRTSRQVSDKGLTFGYQRRDFKRETRIHTRDDAFFTDESFTLRVTVDAGQSWTTGIDVSVATATDRPTLKGKRRPQMPETLEKWIEDAPRLDTSWDDLALIYRRSLFDLAALRFYPQHVPGSLPAAGLPWFMALFGRDSLITSYQALPFTPELCRTTLLALAQRQATEFDDFRDAEPGKILHELRHGELTHFHQRPQSPYYGAADTTPLFLIVLDEYEQWSGDRETVRLLEPAARAALRWIADYGDIDGDGFIEYQTRNPHTGLANQCWKDSHNSIVNPDGRPAPLPRATCELQGYAYDARRRAARLARTCWDDDALAARLDHEADLLRDRFVDAFWLPDSGFYALALDGDKRPVPTLTSNIGHLLWSGIVPEEHADQVIGHLLGERMFSGWGVRTMASGQPAYNPIEYHNGTVWPHDTSIIAAGLNRYERHDEAIKLAHAMLEAAANLDHRLPEALLGTERQQTLVPMPYPSACSPQAWATGTPLLLMRILLDLRPTPEGLKSHPRLPGSLAHLALHGIPGRWGRADVSG